MPFEEGPWSLSLLARTCVGCVHGPHRLPKTRRSLQAARPSPGIPLLPALQAMGGGPSPSPPLHVPGDTGGLWTGRAGRPSKLALLGFSWLGSWWVSTDAGVDFCWVPGGPSTLSSICPASGGISVKPPRSLGRDGSSDIWVQILGGVQKREAQAAPPLPSPPQPMFFPLLSGFLGDPAHGSRRDPGTARKGFQNFAASAKGTKGIGPSGWMLLCLLPKGGGWGSTSREGRRLNSSTASGGSRCLVTGACLAPPKRIKFSYVENRRQTQAVRN